MNVKPVKIIIVADGAKSILKGKPDGKILSDANKINVNKTVYGYSIIIPASEFVRVDYPTYCASIMKLLIKNLPNTKFKIKLEYYYMTIDDYHFDAAVGKKVLAMHEILSAVDRLGKMKELEYLTNQDMIDDIIECIADEENDDDEDDEDDFEFTDDEKFIDDNDYEEDDEDENEINPFAFLMDGKYEMASRKKKRNKRSKRNKDKSSTSAVVRHAHRAKRSVNRHGVIIASKGDIRKDEKIIKEFLKEFIPGSGWKKSFREDVLDRWISSFSISKQKLHRLQKKYRKQQHQKKSKVSKVIRKGILNNDAWYNPSR